MKNRRPHIIIFNPDQFRSDALAHMGSKASVTPHLDSLCQTDGVSFAHAYCQNPVCTPSRSSFMTGWYPHVHGHRTMYHMLQPHEPVLLKKLKDQGYYVWWGGKNDLVPGQNGYQDFCHVHNKSKRRITGYNLHAEADWRGPADGDNFYSFYAGKLQPKPVEKAADDLSANGMDGADDPPYVDGDWANLLDAIDLIHNYQGEQPLCIYLPLGYPHPPYGVEEPYYSQIDRSKVSPPLPPYAEWDDKPSILRGIRQNQQLTGWNESRFTELKATYLGMCARIDHQFGLLLNALRDTGRYDDSAVFFFSDHGDFTGDYGLVEKTQNTFQDCLTRVPFLIKPPKSAGVKPGISNAMVELVDFSATVADLTGLELDYTCFGKSLVPLITGRQTTHRDAVFCEGGRLKEEWHCSEHQYADLSDDQGLYMPRIKLQIKDGPEHGKATMLRTDQYKYVYRLYEKDELYDLGQDPAETINLVDDPAYADVRVMLKERMLQFYMETADVVPFQPDQRSFSD